jgi:hypothetical protein
MSNTEIQAGTMIVLTDQNVHERERLGVVLMVHDCGPEGILYDVLIPARAPMPHYSHEIRPALRGAVTQQRGGGMQTVKASCPECEKDVVLLPGDITVTLHKANPDLSTFSFTCPKCGTRRHEAGR